MHIQPDAPTIMIADQPLWAPGAAQMVADFIRAQPGEVRVLEFGSGGSTKFLLGLGAKVVAVEHHKGWAGALVDAARDMGLGDHLTLLLRDRPYCNVTSEFEIGTTFDLLLIDGRERMDCLRQALPFVRPGGLVLVDDSQRPRYWPAFQILAAEACTTFLSKARNTTIWTLDRSDEPAGFARKWFVASGRSQVPNPFVQLLPREATAGGLQADY